MKRFTDLAFEVRLEPLPDDFKVIRKDLTAIFVVGVNQEVGVLVLLVGANRCFFDHCTQTTLGIGLKFFDFYSNFILD